MLFLAVIFGILVALATFCGRDPALPVSTQWVIAVYEQPEVGFAFSQNTLHTGAIQHIGTTPYHATQIALTDDGGNLTQAFMSSRITDEDIATTLLYLGGFTYNTLPEWEGNVTWVSNHWERAVTDGAQSVQVEDALVELEWIELLGGFYLTISAEGTE